MTERNCYICEVPLEEDDRKNWEGHESKSDLCPRCVALVERKKPTGTMTKRTKGYPAMVPRLKERREAFEIESVEKARKAVTKKTEKTEDDGPKKRGRKPNPPPQDPGCVENTGKGPSVPATVILCLNCGEPNQIPIKTTAGKITAQCSKCKSTIFLKGVVMGKMRVDRKAIKQVEQLGLKPGQEDPEKKGKGTSAGDKSEPKFLTMNFRMTQDQHTIVRLAMEIGRRQCDDAQGRTWHGRVLELICADYLSSAPPDLIEQVRKELEESDD